jgi:hypothetical protein
MNGNATPSVPPFYYKIEIMGEIGVIDDWNLIGVSEFRNHTGIKPPPVSGSW